jgi:hypothetical protein
MFKKFNDLQDKRKNNRKSPVTLAVATLLALGMNTNAHADNDVMMQYFNWYTASGGLDVGYGVYDMYDLGQYPLH